MKPGDKVMLMTRGYWNGLLNIMAATVKRVTPGGQVTINETDERFRPDGSMIGGNPGPKLLAWDDALWGQYEAEQANVAKARKLLTALDILKKKAVDFRNHAEVAALWDGLPESVRALVDGKEGGA